MLYLIFIIEKGLYFAGIPNNIKSDFAIEILEAYFIKIMVPSRNIHMNDDVLTLFGNGVT